MSKARVFRTQVIKPVLLKIGGPNLAAEELLLGTAVQESLNFMYRRQVGGGPAKGYFQMEPATHDDIWDNFLKYRKGLAKDVISFLSSPNANKITELENNDKYAAAMARVHYMRVPAALPKAGDIKAQANYWKQYYNTPLGKGLPHEYIDKWNKYVAPVTP
ncbi:hypothetical protein [Agarivorans sp. DSG3-1]|uniref:hypothetical protein n=1 Tax=Agarivorans sp. DSG3-1 TaxID=3342249 RepID=UPI00398F865C